MKTIKELVGRLIANESPYTEADKETLEGYSEEMLTKLEAAFDVDESTEDVAAEDSEADAVDADAADETVELTEEEQIEALPTALKAMIRKSQAKELKERTDLITALDNHSQTAYAKATLEAKDTDDLTALASALGVGQPEVDYSPRGLEINRGEDSTVAPPPSIREALAAKQAN